MRILILIQNQNLVKLDNTQTIYLHKGILITRLKN